MPAPRTLPVALAEAAAGDCGYTFVGQGSDRRRSYTELRHAALIVAAALRDAGLDRGEVVALVIADAEAFLTALFGASLAGMIPASLYPPSTTGRLDAYMDLTAHALRAAEARAVVTTDGLVEGFERLRGSCPRLDLVLSRERLDAPAREPIDAVSLDDIAFVQFTSGSTSMPKGVALTHRNLGANIDAINGPAGLDTTAADSAVSWLPLHHDMGLVGMALGPLYAARPAAFLATHTFVKRPVEWLRAISRYRATVSFAPNFAYDLCLRRLKDSDLDGLDLSCWRVAGCGAEPIHAPTLLAFAERLRGVGFRETSFLPSYGLAEHVVAATFVPRDRPLRVDGQLVSCGSPFPEHRVRIVDDEGRERAERDVGEIMLSGPSVMSGYYRNDALTEQAIGDGWLRTGDLGYLADGELYVCGRANDLIVAHGRKYHPQDFEWAMDGLSGLRRGRSVAFGVPRTNGPDRVVIVAEPSGTLRAEAVVESVRRRAADLLGVHVDDVVLVPSGAVPRTTSGKVQRAATRALYERGELPRRS